MESKHNFDLSVYLVTSPVASFPSEDAYLKHLETALSSDAITVLQLREKKLSDDAFLALARKVKKLTDKAKVPLVINDNLFVCKEVGAEGLHIGWDDVGYETARKELPESTFIGLSASTLDQALACARLKADYIGLGPIFPTSSKPDANPPCFAYGAREILEELSKLEGAPPVVGIGGIDEGNTEYLQWMCNDGRSGVTLDGVAVISAIMASPQPDEAAKRLKELWERTTYTFAPKPVTLEVPSGTAFRTVLGKVREKKPLVHNMTNTVVQTISANMLLAFHASPIMSLASSEVEDLSKICDGVVLNIGTLDESTSTLFTKAVAAYNAAGKVVVFDPVGAGATKLRRETTKRILESGYITVIKGNASEIATVAGDLAGSVAEQRGVDAVKSDSSVDVQAELVLKVAKRYRTTVVQTGEVDIVSDGTRTWTLRNGTPLQELTTGAGCALGGILAASVAAGGDVAGSCVVGLTAYNLAAERAAKVVGDSSPGSFVGVWVDEVHKAVKDAGAGGYDGARVELLK
ncbi:HK-domain-containing protein [Ascobolus immersus RN42]|uniref:HK-domain-containing protein n=1 Tax=Ascobolus immersus RN42 TaxID=1160509 RepID=A0A3N4I1T6_ASCIM|nr:HK-domain-containing protein [Ascobolus immersus RN42]